MNNTKELTHFISNCLIWSIESWKFTGGRLQGNLNGIGIRVHWIRNVLATQLKRAATIIWRNVCDFNKGTTWCSSTISSLTLLQSKIQKRQLDSSTGNCNSPNTYLWRTKVVWKIGACYKSTWCPTDINSRFASYKELKTRMHTSEYFFIQHVFIVLKVEYRFMWDKRDQYCKKFFSLKFKPINIEFVVKGSIVNSFTGVCSKII